MASVLNAFLLVKPVLLLSLASVSHAKNLILYKLIQTVIATDVIKTSAGSVIR